MQEGGCIKLDAIRTMANAREKMSDESFQQAGSALSDAKNFVREKAQEITSSAIETIIVKLKSDDLISTDEIDLIKAWIVGDAVGYIAMENNFQDWISEYARLQDSLATYENKECSPEDLLKLHGVLEDATRVSYDIANFLEKKERIEKFESAVGDGLDKGERDILVRTLTRKLQSPEY